MEQRKFRDLSFIPINHEETLVIACDSCGGIGNKENDVVKVSPDLVGYFTAHVALSEVLAIGARPISLINTLAVEMEDTGKEILKGINKALSYLDLGDEITINGSTEENIPVCQTAMGVTVIGVVNKKWCMPKTHKGTLAVVVGIPKVGQEVLQDYGKETMSLLTLKKLLQNNKVQEILPVGSKGILHELKELAQSNGLSYVLKDNTQVDLLKSGGPSTCVIISIWEHDLPQLKKEISIPVNVIGEFI